MPFSWHHNITYDNESPQATMSTPASTVRIRAVDLTTDNSFTDKNFGYLIQASTYPRENCPSGFDRDPNMDICFGEL